MTIFVTIASAEWERAKAEGYYAPPSLKSEGFIHCSTAVQVEAVANKHFKGKTDLVLVAVDPDKVSAPIKYENPKDGANLFPHIYGRLEVSAVVEVHSWKPDANGLFSLPQSLKQAPVKKEGPKYAER